MLIYSIADFSLLLVLFSLKDNVALIAVLEAKFGNHGTDNPGKRQLLCVANTHVNVHQDLKDVKLWEVCAITFSLC
jgi:CCR4-NOT transcription complex subunit 6